MLSFTTYLIDLDGVIYRGNALLPGAREFVDWLQAHNKKFLFLTNNSFASETQVLEKLERLGIATDATHLLEAMRQWHSQPEEAVMIGDSLAVDILGGKAAGTHTILVLSGNDSRESAAKSPIKPDYMYQDVAALLAELKG